MPSTNDVMPPNLSQIFAPAGAHIFKGESEGPFSLKPPHPGHSAGAKRSSASNTGLPFDCGVSWDSLGTLNRNGSKLTLQRNRVEDRKKALQLRVWTFLAEDPSSVPGAHIRQFTATCTSISGASSHLYGDLHSWRWGMDTHIQFLNNTLNSFHNKQMGALLQGCRSIQRGPRLRRALTSWP